MTIRGMLRQASSKAFSSIRQSRHSLFLKQSSPKRSLYAPEHLKSFSSDDDDELSRRTQLESEVENVTITTETDCSSLLDQASFFGEELKIVHDNPRITKVTLRDFVHRYERNDVLALTEILRTSDRNWKYIKFDEVIEGTNYRRWQFRKENLRRAVENALMDKSKDGRSYPFPVIFEERLNIDMDDMSLPAVVSLLKEVRKDRRVKSISIDGFLTHQNVESLIGPLVRLLSKGDRRWKSVVLRVSFDGDIENDYPAWDMATTLAKIRLEEVSAKRGIPIGFQIC